MTDLFRQLADRYALAGRLGGKIVIDASQAPAMLFDELHGPFLACYLASETESIPIFSDLVEDETSQTVLLDADTVLQQDFERIMQYPALYEIRKLIDGIPPLPQELADHFRLATMSY